MSTIGLNVKVNWATKISLNRPNFQGGITNKKYVFKYIKNTKIGAMLRSTFVSK